MHVESRRLNSEIVNLLLFGDEGETSVEIDWVKAGAVRENVLN